MIGQVADVIKDSLATKLKMAKLIAVLIEGYSDVSNNKG